MNLNFNPLDSLKNEGDWLYNITTEYLRTANRYKNLFKYSLPIRILTPDEDVSIYDKITDLTYDKKTLGFTGYRYNLYEYVPAYFVNPLIFNPLIDDTGLKIDVDVSISLIGFNDITIGSYIMFYADYLSSMIFEVTNIRTPLLSNIHIPIYELELVKSTLNPELLSEYIQTGQIIIKEIFYYDITCDKFITKDEYERKIATVNDILQSDISYFKTNFDYTYGAYFYVSSGELEKIYEKYLNLYFLDYIGRVVNRRAIRFDFPIPTAPILYPEKFTPDETDYLHIKSDYEFWKQKLYSLSSLSEIHNRTYNLHLKLREGHIV